MKPTYYEFFGLNNFEPSQQVIKAAYRKMALLHHPDRNNDKEDATRMMKQVNEVYRVLSECKGSYDRHLRTKLNIKKPFEPYFKTEAVWGEDAAEKSESPFTDFADILRNTQFHYTFTDGHFSNELTRAATKELQRKLKIKKFMDDLSELEFEKVCDFVELMRTYIKKGE